MYICYILLFMYIYSTVIYACVHMTVTVQACSSVILQDTYIHPYVKTEPFSYNIRV